MFRRSFYSSCSCCSSRRAAAAPVGATPLPDNHHAGRPASDRLPVADRDRDALRHRRGQAGGRRGRPVQLPGECAAHNLRATSPTSRPSRATTGSRRRLGDPGGIVDGLAKLSIDVLIQEARQNLDGAYDEIEELGTSRAPAAGDASSTRMRDQIANLVAGLGGTGVRASSTSSGPTYYSATSKTFIGSIYEELGQEHRRRGREEGARLPAAVGGVHRQAESRPDRPRGHEMLRPDPREGGRAPRMEADRRRCGRGRRGGRRRHRLEVGPPDCRLRATRVGGHGGGVVIAMQRARGGLAAFPASRSAGR